MELVFCFTIFYFCGIFRLTKSNMGKLKKPCKNAYFYFIMEEKEKYVNQGYRFNGGFNEASQMFGHLWSVSVFLLEYPKGIYLCEKKLTD